MKNMNENDVKSDTIADMNTKKTNGNVNDFLVPQFCKKSTLVNTNVDQTNTQKSNVKINMSDLKMIVNGNEDEIEIFESPKCFLNLYLV